MLIHYKNSHRGRLPRGLGDGCLVNTENVSLLLLTLNFVRTTRCNVHDQLMGNTKW